MSRNRSATSFEREIEELQQRLLDLARAVESALGQATKALLNQNEEMAEHVIVGEDSVNTATYEIEDYVTSWWPASSRWPPTCASS